MVRVYLSVNGRSEPINFYSDDIHPYDVILGEDWLHHNRTILDYDSCQLLTRDVHVGVTPLCLDCRVRAAQGAEREQDIQRKSSGVRARRTELWTTVRHALGVITGYPDKCLTEDEELVLEDIRV